MEVFTESFLFAGSEPCKTRYSRIRKGSLKLYRMKEDKIIEYYTEHKDYRVDYSSGYIYPLTCGKLPDFCKSVLYGKNNFDHREVHETNHTYTVYGDYESEDEKFALPYGDTVLTAAVRKLQTCGKITYLVFGDSISTGCEAFGRYRYFCRLKEYLEHKYGGEVEIVNKSVCGDNTDDGLRRLRSVITESADLVTIAFGTNDHAKDVEKPHHDSFVSVERFGENLRCFVDLFRGANPSVDIFAISPFEVNSKWYFKTDKLPEYINEIKRVCKEKNLGYANVYEYWQAELRAGKTEESLLGNNINHPNNYGHGVYFDAIRPIFG